MSSDTVNDQVAAKQRKRGYSDGKYGHSPSHLRGPYMDGYAQGRSGREFNPDYRLPPDPIDELRARIKELEARVCTYPEGMKYCICPHFRGTP